MATVRISPNPNGTFFAMLWNEQNENYDVVAPTIACRLMQVPGTQVEIAMSHPTDRNSHLEGRAEMTLI